MAKFHSFSYRLLLLLFVFIMASVCSAQTPTNVTVLPNIITAGSNTSGMVALSAATTKPETLKLASNTTGVTVPATVAIPKGEQFVSFSISSKATLATSTVAVTANLNGGSAVGFLLVNAETVSYPSFSSLTLSPSVDAVSTKITGTLAFAKPLLVAMTFNLASSNSNFSVPSSLSVKAGAQTGSFSVTAGASASTSVVTITATVAPGLYQNVFSGPTSEAGAFTYIAGNILPPNYKSAFWVGEPTANGDGNIYIPTIKTYASGQISFGLLQFDPVAFGYFDFGYAASGHVSASGQFDVEADNMGRDVFNAYLSDMGQNGHGTSNVWPSYLFDGSSITFSTDGNSLQLIVVAQEYTWTLSAIPSIVFGEKKTLGTYKLSLAQQQ